MIITIGNYYVYRTNSDRYTWNQFRFHTPLVYGYRESGNKTYYLTHLGWPGEENASAWIDITTAVDYAYIEYSSENHVHSENYIYDDGTNNFKMCPSHGDNYYFTYSNFDDGNDKFVIQCQNVSGENSTCIENFEVEQDHYYTSFSQISQNNTEHRRYCEYCGNNDIENHNYLFYEYKNEQKHTMKCYDCGKLNDVSQFK